ncbi:MAG: phenylacetic acid degradation protein PaaD [Acidimicrobiaceae bacterium]|nr:phenylacetic acid degradation protein PaaD [Acidimicrobiaceae bacterium]
MGISEEAAALYANDPSAVTYGIELVAADTDGAHVKMVIQPGMCNGLGIVHGGMVFLLADSAMAFASNSGPSAAVATSAEIDWLAPARAGQTLVATATRRWGSKRSGLWDITVTADDTTIALFRGRTRSVG